MYFYIKIYRIYQKHTPFPTQSISRNLALTIHGLVKKSTIACDAPRSSWIVVSLISLLSSTCMHIFSAINMVNY